MRELWMGLFLCATLVACSSKGGTASSPGVAGSNAGSGGAMAGGGGSSAGTGGGATGGSAGAQSDGGAGANPNWPTYDEALASPQSTRVLVLLLDFADSDQNQMLPNAEARWGEMIFGRKQS